MLYNQVGSSTPFCLSCCTQENKKVVRNQSTAGGPHGRLFFGKQCSLVEVIPQPAVAKGDCSFDRGWQHPRVRSRSLLRRAGSPLRDAWQHLLLPQPERAGHSPGLQVQDMSVDCSTPRLHGSALGPRRRRAPPALPPHRAHHRGRVRSLITSSCLSTNLLTRPPSPLITLFFTTGFNTV